MATSNGSKALGALHKMALADDSIRITAFAGLADVNLKYYGQGPIAAERDLFITLNENGWATHAAGAEGGFREPLRRREGRSTST